MPVSLANVAQNINGNQYDWSSIEANVDNAPYGGFKGLNWSHSLEPGEGRGTRAQVALRSRGKYSADADFEMYTYEYMLLIAKLGQMGARGYMEYSFDILVSFVEKNLPMVSFTLAGCRIKKEGHSHSEDGGLATVKADLSVLRIIPTTPGANTPLFAVEPTKFIK
jgi:hypothetical protein